MQFPEIIKNRHVWSFKNGIFIGKEWSAQNWALRIKLLYVRFT
jgi:hypothetical protein